MELHIYRPDKTACEFCIFLRHMHRINSPLNFISTKCGRVLSIKNVFVCFFLRGGGRERETLKQAPCPSQSLTPGSISKP